MTTMETNPTKKLSVADKLVIAMLQEEQETGTSSVTAEALVVRAWRSYPDTFGLRGQVDSAGKHLFPDSNRVFVEIMGNKPVRAKGLIEKPGDKTYRLTDAGRELALSLIGVEDAGTRRTTMKREDFSRLQRLLNSRALAKFSSGDRDSVTFTDACTFWGISPGVGSRALVGKRNGVLALLRQGVLALGDKDEMATSNSGLSKITRESLEQAAALDQFLEERFPHELALIRARTDDRLKS